MPHGPVKRMVSSEFEVSTWHHDVNTIPWILYCEILTLKVGELDFCTSCDNYHTLVQSPRSNMSYRIWYCHFHNMLRAGHTWPCVAVSPILHQSIPPPTNLVQAGWLKGAEVFPPFPFSIKDLPRPEVKSKGCVAQKICGGWQGLTPHRYGLECHFEKVNSRDSIAFSQVDGMHSWLEWFLAWLRCFEVWFCWPAPSVPGVQWGCRGCVTLV